MALGATRNERWVHEVVGVMKYEAHVQERHIVVNRPGPTFGMSALNNQVKKKLAYWNHGLHLGSYPDLRGVGILDAKESSENDNKDMQDLNERLANYIESVRFYKAQNFKLDAELTKLKNKWEKEPSQDRFQVELDAARRLLELTVNKKSELEFSRVIIREEREKLEQKLILAVKAAKDAKEKFEHQNEHLSNLEGKASLLRRRLASLETERDTVRARNKELQDYLNEIYSKLNKETRLNIAAENRRKTLDAELKLLMDLRDQLLKEMQAWISRDSTAENLEYWKTEMGKALRVIHEQYDDRMEEIKIEQETNYSLKLETVQTNAIKSNMELVHFEEERKRLTVQLQIESDKVTDAKNKYVLVMRQWELLVKENERECELKRINLELTQQVAKLKAENEAMLAEVKKIFDAKHGLELEIMTYRRLLETEENTARFRQKVNAIEFSGESHGEFNGHYNGHEIGFERDQIVDSLVSVDESHEFTIRQTESTSGGCLSNIVDYSTNEVSQVVTGEMKSKTTYQKSAKGPTEFLECSQDGKYVALQNNGRKEEHLGNWSLTSRVDGKDCATYMFSDSFVLRPGEKVKVWSRGEKPSNGATEDIEWDKNWVVGAHIIIKLRNPAGEDRATYIQQTRTSGNMAGRV